MISFNAYLFNAHPAHYTPIWLHKHKALLLVFFASFLLGWPTKTEKSINHVQH